MNAFLNNFFKLEERKTDVRTEFMGGLTTFLTMAYIIFVNPNILGETGMDKGALITVTILAAVIGTLLAGLWANVPFAMAPGMGLNAFFTYTLCFGMGVEWQTALGIVFVSGVSFLLLTLVGIREKIVDAIPLSLRLAVAAGIGLFITFIGFKNMGLIVDNPATLVSMGEWTTPLILGVTGLVITAFLEAKRVKGGIFWGIIITTLLGVAFNQVTLPEEFVSTPPSIAPIAFKLDVLAALKWGFIGAIFSFMFVDLFDSVGTIVACSYEAGLVKKDGKIPHIGKILEADAVATVIGTLLGTSTTTTFIESASGIANGARTGLASVFTAIFFALCLVFTPVIGMVPAFATAPALVIVGVYMFKNVKKIDFEDFTEAFPAFVTIIIMPLTYSISTGLSFGFVAWVLLQVAAGRIKNVPFIMWIIAALSVLNLVIG